MQSLIYIVFVALVKISLCQASVDTFEFGKNKGRVAFTTTGRIGVLDKLVRVPIVVPPCQIVTYVRVDVDNMLGPPKVDVDADMDTVIIQYRLLQISFSSYTVTAKTIKDRACQ